MRQGWMLSIGGGAAHNGMEPLTELGKQLPGSRVIEAARAAMAIQLAQRAHEIASDSTKLFDRPRAQVNSPRTGGLS